MVSVGKIDVCAKLAACAASSEFAGELAAQII
jgi:hypothetical protein